MIKSQQHYRAYSKKYKNIKQVKYIGMDIEEYYEAYGKLFLRVLYNNDNTFEETYYNG